MNDGTAHTYSIGKPSYVCALLSNHRQHNNIYLHFKDSFIIYEFCSSMTTVEYYTCVWFA